VTTVLHWDRFDHHHVCLWAWIALYGSTPVLLSVLWARNRRTDAGTLSAEDVRLPFGVRVAVAAGGTVQLTVAAVMFGWPHVAVRWCRGLSTRPCPGRSAPSSPSRR
jgi:hypothetical protein